MSGTYTFQPRQPLNPTTVKSPFSSTSTTPINSTTTSPRQQTLRITRNGNGNGNGNGTGTAAPPKSQPHPLQLNLQSSRQLKPPQLPLYVPAVLRQIDRPSAARLSRNASQASLKNSPKEKMTTITPAMSTASLQNGNEDQNKPHHNQSFLSSSSFSVGPGSASGTEEEDDIYELLDNESITISKEAEAEWYRSEKLGEVIGSPTREHWRADAVSPICDFPGCRTSFGIFMRRHHCRHCGHVFCASHTPSIVPLDQNARFHPNGEYGRACEMCHKAYLKWDRRRLYKLIAIERDIEEQRRWEEEGGKNAEGKTRGRAMLKPGMGGGPGMCDDPNDILNGGGIGWPQHHVGSLLSGSVPRDWSWSTF
ncbi:hypothetical protein KEM54_003603 [Ascosphaera aggregata]|nr:hypothetical protein KEM54_003603 [Ascosphaera aggregata]